jgi:hypothetical protein
MDILSIEHLTKVYGTGPAAVRARAASTSGSKGFWK